MMAGASWALKAVRVALSSATTVNALTFPPWSTHAPIISTVPRARVTKPPDNPTYGVADLLGVARKITPAVNATALIGTLPPLSVAHREGLMSAVSAPSYRGGPHPRSPHP